MKTALLLCAWILFAYGCATTAHGPSYLEARASAPQAGLATLYVFRDYAEPTAWGADIQVNGQPVATLNQGGFTWVQLKPGKTEIKAIWAGMSGQKDSYISIRTQAGKTYYTELTGISKADVSFPMIYFKVGSGLNEVKPEAAEKKLENCCKFQKPATMILRN